MGAMIFFMAVAFCGSGIVAVIFGIQVMMDHSKGKTTAWSKRTGVVSIILGAIVTICLGTMLIIVIFDL